MYSAMVEPLTPESREKVDAILEGRSVAVAGARAGRPVLRTAARRGLGPNGEHVPGTAPLNMPAPEWWRGDHAAFDSSVAAGQQLGEPAARGEAPRRGLPTVGTSGMR